MGIETYARARLWIDKTANSRKLRGSNTAGWWGWSILHKSPEPSSSL